MARAKPHVAGAPPSSPVTTSPTWGDWSLKLQASQVHAARDMLGVLSRYAAALGAARGVDAVRDAQRAVVGEWAACLESAQREWAQLALAVPTAALSACGWRLKPGAGLAEADGVGSRPNLFEQSKLGIEMLLRPWIDAPDLEHTDEFVA